MQIKASVSTALRFNEQFTINLIRSCRRLVTRMIGSQVYARKVLNPLCTIGLFTRVP